MRNVVNCIDVSDGDSARVVAINQSKGLVDHSLSALGERVTKTTNELLISDVAIAINIVVLHEGLDFDDLREKTILGKSFGKFTLVELLVTVVVHAAEEDAKRADADTTTLLDLHLELIVDAANFNVKANAVQLRHLL